MRKNRWLQITIIMMALGLLSPNVALGEQTDAQARKLTTKSAADTLTNLLKAVKNAYREAEDFKLDFEQTYHSRMTRRKQKSEGEVLFQRPMKMRWNYQKPDKRSFIIDGETLWVVEWEEKTASVRKNLDQSELESSLAFLWGGGDIKKDYTAAIVEAKIVEGVIEKGERIILELFPKKPAQFETLYLAINPKNHHIEETLLLDAIGNKNHLIFKNFKGKQSLKGKSFTFEKPNDQWTIETINP